MTKKSTKKPFDKYYYYSLSVQSPEADVSFIHDTYKKLKKKKPKVFREDFCAAFANCCEWVKQGPEFEAYALDIDEEPLSYGKKNYLPELSTTQQKQVHVQKKDVLSSNLPKADVACALNFSYFCFKDRDVLKKYFANAYKALNKDGIFIMDCFGGTDSLEESIEETEHEDEDFSYFWEQNFCDPITHHCTFAIHFKRKREAMRKNVFTYDWRIWTLPEIRDILNEVGFKKVTIHWEGTTKDGEGNGIFKPVKVGEDCEAWIAYIVAEK